MSNVMCVSMMDRYGHICKVTDELNMGKFGAKSNYSDIFIQIQMGQCKSKAKHHLNWLLKVI